MLDFLPILLGSDDNAYGVARQLHERYGDRCRPLLLCARALRATAHSRLFDLRAIEHFDDEAVFVPALRGVLREKSREAEKLLVIPLADYYFSLLVRNQDKFSPYIANKFPSQNLLLQIESKDKFYALCDKCDLPYPKTVVAQPGERERALSESSLRFPIVVKPENSNAAEYLHCSFPGKKKVFFVQNEREYLQIVREMGKSGYRGKLILQEFIPGDDTAMRTCNLYVGSDGSVRAAVLGQPILEEVAPATLGNYAAILPRRDERVEAMLSDFLAKIGYIGFANIDMKLDARTGKTYLFELNPRLGRSSFFAHTAGVNLPALMVDDVVYGSTERAVPTGEERLWCAVPRRTLLRYLRDPALREKASRLFREGKVERTLVYARDLSPARKLLLTRHILSYDKVYRKYYFDKDAPGG